MHERPCGLWRSRGRRLHWCFTRVNFWGAVGGLEVHWMGIGGPSQGSLSIPSPLVVALNEALRVRTSARPGYAAPSLQRNAADAPARSPDHNQYSRRVAVICANRVYWRCTDGLMVMAVTADPTLTPGADGWVRRLRRGLGLLLGKSDHLRTRNRS